MSIDFKKLRIKFEKFIRDRFPSESIEQHRQDDLAEMVQEIEEELLDGISYDADSKKVANFIHFCQPSDDEVMSYDLEGKVLSRYGDESWYRIEKSGKKRGYHFTAKRGEDDAYRTDPQARPLAVVERLLLYAIWPGKDPTQRPYSDASLDAMHKSIRILLSWFYVRGYFLSSSTDKVPHDNELITVEAVRSELVTRTSENFLLFHLEAFLSGVRLWMLFGTKKWCPGWFRPTFAYKNVIDEHLAKDIAKCIARKRNRWEAIDFDSLKPLFFTAQNYLELYTVDIFWLLERFELAYHISEASNASVPEPDIRSYGRTGRIYKEVCERAYAIDPQTCQPWFAPEISSSSSEDRDGNPCWNQIRLTPVASQLRCLVGAATFILFSFTGMRHREMKTMKTGALLIDGKELDETGDIFAQVEAGTTFDLIRTLFKPNPSPSGEQHMTPIPKIAAKAYAVLVKVFSYSRSYVDPEAEGTPVTPISDFLFPSNGQKFKWWQSRGCGPKTENTHMTSVHRFLKRFCEAAGVDYFFPHMCRKTLATLLINHDPECLEVIRWLLGHNSIMMTYEYIMSLPGIRDEVLEYLRDTNAKNLAEFVGDTLTGHVAGAAGNRALDAVVENLESWKGQKLAHTMRVMIKAYDDANFSLVRTPAAWCVRFPSRVPHTAPCLPPAIQDAIKNGEATEIVVPRFEHCIPWECGDAGHTRSDLTNAKRSHTYARKMAAISSGKAHAEYQIEADYWEKVVNQLEYGRQDVSGESLLLRWANSSLDESDR